MEELKAAIFKLFGVNDETSVVMRRKLMALAHDAYKEVKSRWKIAKSIQRN